MKITEDDYKELSEKVLAVISEYKRILDIDLLDTYEYGDFPRANKVSDLQERFNFDLLSVASQADPALSTKLYKYLNDDHIATALKKICPVVKQRYTVCSLTGSIQSNRPEFEVGDFVTYAPYCEYYRVKVLAVDHEKEPGKVFYRLSGDSALAFCSGMCIAESKFFKPYKMMII